MSDHVLMWAIVILCAYECVILTMEYFYDAGLEEEKRNRRVKRTRNKVKVEIDSEGHARITEAPKGVDVSLEHRGEE